MGARPLKRVIQSKILTPVANQMVGEGMFAGGTVKVSLQKDELKFDVKKRTGKTVAKKTARKKVAATAV